MYSKINNFNNQVAIINIFKLQIYVLSRPIPFILNTRCQSIATQIWKPQPYCGNPLPLFSMTSAALIKAICISLDLTLQFRFHNSASPFRSHFFSCFLPNNFKKKLIYPPPYLNFCDNTFNSCNFINFSIHLFQ